MLLYAPPKRDALRSWAMAKLALFLIMRSSVTEAEGSRTRGCANNEALKVNQENPMRDSRRHVPTLPIWPP
ncbi:hypothetical protein N7539_005433 [Penicillium diatomitis]|uniref:Secreted protein n=1 Tax=Penicillium diatomitis TaxID=2819901 RepID=A0A9X0BVA1_9EURO|nr:uncharacterized protein N7539_005433 [Penicillium diatomitis]KAJ5485445.1 hypothetical protein N7539_005433 [Penicillium diatomitis]